MDAPEGLTWYEESLPSQCHVLGTSYHLIVTPHDHPALHGAEGLTDFRTNAIYLQKGLPPLGLLNVLWHELTHAINETGEIENGVKEERIAAWHGQTWPTFFILNPAFSRWWDKVVTSIIKDRHDA